MDSCFPDYVSIVLYSPNPMHLRTTRDFWSQRKIRTHTLNLNQWESLKFSEFSEIITDSNLECTDKWPSLPDIAPEYLSVRIASYDRVLLTLFTYINSEL